MEANITLWQFLLELLLNEEYKEIISWTNDEGEFKLVNAEEVAKLWGMYCYVLPCNSIYTGQCPGTVHGQLSTSVC